jgi:hypothetical protein
MPMDNMCCHPSGNRPVTFSPLDGFRIGLLRREADMIETIMLHHPNGIFRPCRIAEK